MESERLIPETLGLLDQDLNQGPPALADDDIQDYKQTIRGRIVSTIANQTYRVTASVFIVWFLLEFGLLALHVPGSRLFERAVCRRYYRDEPSMGGSYHVLGEIDEHLCKISPIQQEVALLVGWRDSFLAIPSIFTAVFYGSLADRYGRKPILLLAGTGEMLVIAWLFFICYFDWIFNPRLSWASALFIFIGGGQRVVVAMLFTILSAQIDETHRTRYMYIMNIGPHLSGLVTPPVEAVTMSASFWLPFVVSIGAYILMLLVILAMPEPKKQLHTTRAEILNVQDEPTEATTEDNQSSKISHRPLSGMLKTPNLVICFLLYFLKRTAFMSEIFFYQYASANFDFELRQTPWFRSIKEISAIIVLSLVLPAITASFQRRYNSQAIDLNVLRGSLVTMVVSFFTVYVALSSWFFAFGVLLCGAGEGIDPGIQGLASTFVVSDHRAMMFTILAMIDASGKIIGGPLMATLYSLGMDADGRSGGWCFLATSVLFGTAILISLRTRLSRRETV